MAPHFAIAWANLVSPAGPTSPNRRLPARRGSRGLRVASRTRVSFLAAPSRSCRPSRPVASKHSFSLEAPKGGMKPTRSRGSMVAICCWLLQDRQWDDWSRF